MIASEDLFELLVLLLVLLLLRLLSPVKVLLLLVLKLLEVVAGTVSRGSVILTADEAPEDEDDNFDADDDCTTAEDDDDGVELDDEEFVAFVMSFEDTDETFDENVMDGTDRCLSFEFGLLFEFSSTAADGVGFMSWQVCSAFVLSSFNSLDTLFPLFDAKERSRGGGGGGLLFLAVVSDFLLGSALTRSDVLDSDFEDCTSILTIFIRDS